MAGRKRATKSKASGVVSPGVLLGVFGVAIFLSAALLFAVQPMFTKMVLPTLGGSPQVWSVAMVFFQTALLAGYAYAHLITRNLSGPANRHYPSGGDGGRDLLAAALDGHRLGQAAGARRGVLAARAVRAFDRVPVLRALGERAAVAGLVRAHRSSGGQGPVLFICGEQCRKLPRAAELSVRDRAAQQAWRADPRLVDSCSIC